MIVIIITTILGDDVNAETIKQENEKVYIFKPS